MATTKPFVLHLFDDRVAVERADGSGAALVLARAVPEAPLEAYVDEKGKVLKEVAGGQLIPIDAIFGIYHLLSGPYLALVTDSEVAVAVAGLEFRRITKAAIIPLIKSGAPLSEERQADEDRYLELLHAAISSHQFYFSYTHDVTQTLQRLATRAQALTAAAPQPSPAGSGNGNGAKGSAAAGTGAVPLWQRADERFFWNRELVSELVAAKAHDWIVPMMNAFLDFRPNCSIGSVTAPGRRHRFHLLFVSRRSRHRQGCRFTMRGLDEEGHVANFVETEQALLHEDGRQTSFVQIRGSIPLFWASPVCMKVRPSGRAWWLSSWSGRIRRPSCLALSRHLGTYTFANHPLTPSIATTHITQYTPRVYLGDENKSLAAAKKHVDELVELYGPLGVVFVNLVDMKKDQQTLGIRFKQVVDALGSKALRYVWFDFHHECKKMKYQNLAKLVRASLCLCLCVAVCVPVCPPNHIYVSRRQAHNQNLLTHPPPYAPHSPRE